VHTALHVPRSCGYNAADVRDADNGTDAGGPAVTGQRNGRGTRLVAWAASSRLAHILVLALPFVIVIAGWHGLGASFSALQGGDEPLHWEVVQAVQRQWPFPVLGGYGAWSGPLVYWVLATLALPLGGSFVATRLVVTLFSWGTCAVAYVLFRDRLRARPTDALALSLLLAVSPFFFGQSFHVLTDNPTWFFVVLGLERLLAYTQRPALTRFAAFAACLAAASLMRHISVWLLLPGLVALLSTPAPRGRRIAALGLLALSVLPIAALLVYWGGPLPPAPGGIAAPTPLAAGYRLRNLLLSLAVAGWYALFLLPAGEIALWWRRARADWRWSATLAAPALVVLTGVAAGALGVITSYLGLVSRLSFPHVAGSSLLWWVLAPAGAAVVAGLTATRRADVQSRVLLTALLGVLLSALANPRWFERYVDFPILLLLAGLAVTAAVTLRRSDRERWALALVVAVAAFFLLV
jgi:hypothetical protein